MGNWETGMFSTEMPRFSTVLRVEWQHGELCMWALVDPEAEKEQRHFIIVGTGHEVQASDDSKANLSPEGYRGTFQYLGGDLIFHIFEVFRDAAR